MKKSAILSSSGLVSKGEQRTVMPYPTLLAVCFYCRMFIVAGLLCFRMHYYTNDIITTTITTTTTTMTTIKRMCEHKLATASVRQKNQGSNTNGVMPKIHVSQDVKLCHWVNGSRHVEGTLEATALHFRRRGSSAAPLCKPQISQGNVQ
jgi:hypothetical protein